MTNFRRILLVASALTSIIATSAMAVDLTFQYYAYGDLYNDAGSPNSFAPGSGGTFSPFFNYIADNNRITVEYISSTVWSSSEVSLNTGGLYIDNGALFTNPNVNITGVALNNALSSGLGTFNSSNITFNANNVALSWADLSFAAGSTIVLDLNSATSAAVPEPATWAMMLLGFGAIGYGMRRRRQRHTVSYSFA